MSDDASSGLDLDDEGLIRAAKLGETADAFSLRGINDFAVASLQMAIQATRRIDIFTHNLEPAIYAQSGFVDAVSAFARANPHTAVRILLFEPGIAVRSGNALLNLAQRLPTSMQIRKVNSHYAGREESYMLVDDAGLVYRAHPESFEGYAEFAAPARVREKSNEFHEVWDRSKGDPELNRLGL